MANPRELAEQAIALLQNALSESEARASDLDEQLKRKRAPKTRLEEQLDVLTHRLESVEAERQRWEQQAGHLEEIAEAERVKVAQLKKKLEIAEAGPEKLTKKEINFWKQKAEEIDAQIKEYQERLANLRRELNQRDALIDELRANGGAAEAAPSQPQPEAQSDEQNQLRRQLEQRDAWLAELRLELHELRGQPAPPLETEAEVETLRSKITGLERALAEAHNTRAAAQADLMRWQHDIAGRERALREAAASSEATLREAAAASERAMREAIATGDRARATLAEREHRIVELSAEVEHLRNDLRQREEQQRDRASTHDEQVAALTRDVESLQSRLEQDRQETAAARAALDLALHEREQEIERQRQLLTANEFDFQELRRQLAQREQAAAEARRQLEEQEHDAHERDRELAQRQQQLRELSQALAERDQRLESSAAEVEQTRATLAAHAQEIESLRDTLHSTNRELEHARATLTSNERELTSLRETLLGSSRELDELRAVKQRLERMVAEADGRTAALANEMESAREQLAGLETELKEEREHAESLGELANERREHMTKLQEQVEEAEERFAEANWKLGKSLYFERIVKRRKGLVLKLLAALRAKMKANVALKAGLDGLRTFKATAEMNQHKLLQRIDGLKAELKEAEETVKRHQGGTAAKEELTKAVSHATALEERLNTQAELIQALEADLKKAKRAKPADDKSQEAERLMKDVERLNKELETKNQVILALEADTEDQQRKLSKLRGSEGETQRLKAMTEKDRSEIDALQREVTQLREALARQTAAAQASSNTADLEAKLKERESSVTRLMATIKEHEATIKRLNESNDSWKRKYQFLASDQPDAYKSVAEK
jgi:chromosome segregation ATPase